MANLNKVMLIGRLTREPEARSFSNGGKVVKFGFAVNNRRKNQSTGQWEDEPVFVDCEAFNRGDQGGLADRIEQSLHKGSQIFLEGHLRFDQWTDKEGNKRSRLLVRVDNFQYLDPRGDGGGGGAPGGSGGYQRSQSPRPSSPPRSDMGGGGYDDPGPDQEGLGGPGSRSSDEEIPF
jgi:single-strand DNA-binding protein